MPRARIFLKTVGTSALSFGVFLMAGSAIRCDEEHQDQRFARPSMMPAMRMPSVAAPVYGVGLGAILGERWTAQHGRAR